MKKGLVFVLLGFLAGGLAVGTFAKVAIYPITIFGRRFTPAWITFDKDSVGAPDIKKLYDQVQDKEEFHAMVLMNEVHGHIGPWSIVGSKMALRAMDLLDARYATMTAISEGGNVPPHGCITDGIVIGGCCTVGRGLLKLSGGPYKPAATFLYEDRAVRLEAKPFVGTTIRDSIQTIIAETGGTEYVEYWMRVRAFGIEVWKKWDRSEIFEEAWGDPNSVTAVEDALVARPAGFSLSQNRPNPFNAATSISFSLPQAAPVELEVYNSAGQRVRTLLRGKVAGGQNSLTWDGRDDNGRDMASGVYLYRLQVGPQAVAMRKLLLLR